MEQELADLYTVLGIGRRATPDEIVAAFDAWNARADAGESIDDALWERIRYAYDVLSSPSRRVLYDSLVDDVAGDALSLDLLISAETLPLLETPQLLYALITLRPRGAADQHRRRHWYTRIHESRTDTGRPNAGWAERYLRPGRHFV